MNAIAIRELITNAVMHRSYVNCGASAITVALYDDRLEITSPGGVPRGSNIRRMEEGYSLCRNEAIARVFAYLRYAEVWGFGLPKAVAKITDAGLPPPVFSDWGNAIRIVVYREGYSQKSSQKNKAGAKSAIMEMMLADPAISTQQIADQLCISRRMVTKRIGILKSEGLIRRIGPDKGGYWEVVK